MFDVSSNHQLVLGRRRQRREDVPAHHLAREIALTLAIKGVLLYGIWAAFFSQPSIDSMIDGMEPDRVSAAITTSAAFDAKANQLQESPQ